MKCVYQSLFCIYLGSLEGSFGQKKNRGRNPQVHRSSEVGDGPKSRQRGGAAASSGWRARVPEKKDEPWLKMERWVSDVLFLCEFQMCNFFWILRSAYVFAKDEFPWSFLAVFLEMRSEKQWQKRYAQWEKEELARQRLNLSHHLFKKHVTTDCIGKMAGQSHLLVACDWLWLPKMIPFLPGRALMEEVYHDRAEQVKCYRHVWSQTPSHFSFRITKSMFTFNFAAFWLVHCILQKARTARLKHQLREQVKADIAKERGQIEQEMKRLEEIEQQRWGSRRLRLEASCSSKLQN